MAYLNPSLYTKLQNQQYKRYTMTDKDIESIILIFVFTISTVIVGSCIMIDSLERMGFYMQTMPDRPEYHYQCKDCGQTIDSDKHNKELCAKCYYDRYE